MRKSFEALKDLSPTIQVKHHGLFIKLSNHLKLLWINVETFAFSTWKVMIDSRFKSKKSEIIIGITLFFELNIQLSNLVSLIVIQTKKAWKSFWSIIRMYVRWDLGDYGEGIGRWAQYHLDLYYRFESIVEINRWKTWLVSIHFVIAIPILIEAL